jgi:hypothetical protein
MGVQAFPSNFAVEVSMKLFSVGYREKSSTTPFLARPDIEVARSSMFLIGWRRNAENQRILGATTVLSLPAGC